MVIDSHQHFWKYNVERHAWIDDSMAVIRKDFLPSDLKSEFDAHGVSGCVAVQADQTLEETDFLLTLSKENDFIKGVVGWVDLRSPQLESALESYSQEVHLKGFRHIVQGEADPNFLLREAFCQGIAKLKPYGYTYDILVFPHQLGAVLEFVDQFPEQPFVIDHIAKPYIKDGFFEGWAVLMREIAKREHVYCKLSGMVTEADYNAWTPDQLQPYMETVLNAFGPGRLMYGSDWPVCLVAASYGEVKNLATDFIGKLSLDEQAAIMGQNAMHFYSL